ncbi:hypothetical protein KAW18_02815 [candidate division WOR-3 bacterium]|nr:hypothetical protein [candidate division WOR-3 bacterium]
MNETYKPKILEERTEKTCFLKRVTHIKVEINGKVIEADTEHYVKPIDILVDILDYFSITRIAVKAGDTTVIRWKLPFQTGVKVTTSALEEAIRREGGFDKKCVKKS